MADETGEGVLQDVGRRRADERTITIGVCQPGVS